MSDARPPYDGVMPDADPAFADDLTPVIVVVLGGRAVALPASVVSEILPRPRFSPVTGAAPWIVGLIDHRGNLLPVVDGAILLGGEPVPSRLGSRVVLLEVPSERGDGSMGLARFGLLCEQVRERKTLATGRASWRPGDEGDASRLLPLVGRIGSEAVPLLDPRRIVVHDRMLAPSAVAASAALPERQA